MAARSPVYPCRHAHRVFAIATKSKALSRYYPVARVPIGRAVGVRLLRDLLGLLAARSKTKNPEINFCNP
ncbi:MAG: hypothetical protein U0792_16970 [Gemmataceae bacterium]